MSVIVSHRHESRLEVLVHAVRMRDALNEFSMRNFGIKNPEQAFRKKHISGNNKSKTVSKYMVLIGEYGKRIDFLSAQVTGYTRAANTVFPRSPAEFDLRREYQDRALVACEQLVGELQSIAGCFNADLNKYRQYIELIDREIALIKKWRQSDNRLKTALMK